MGDSKNIVDKYRDGYSIELFESDPYFAMRVYYRGVPVGYARCLFENGHVELTDIKISGRLQPSPFQALLLSPFHRFMAKNYQSRGLGTKLLKEIIAYSRELGAVSIHGSLVGKKDLLAKWFTQQGFEVDSATGKILLRLDGGNS
jgi:GNAT superfamily N-acetyltransferase